jgi:hypothetical protein
VFYCWNCVGTNPLACNDFLAAAGEYGCGDLISYELPLEPGDVFIIGLRICVENPLTCTLYTTNTYDGV